MNRGSVQREDALPSWRTITVLQSGVLYYLWLTSLGYQIVPIGSRASVLTVVRFFPDEVGVFQILDGPLDCATGEGQVPGNGVDAWPGNVILVLAVVQIEVDQLCPVRQVHGVEEVQFSHPTIFTS